MKKKHYRWFWLRRSVDIPPDNLLGKEGKGFKIAMSILNKGRTGLGGGAVGGMKACIGLADSFPSANLLDSALLGDLPANNLVHNGY